jgi:phosphoglycolate phosphatase
VSDLLVLWDLDGTLLDAAGVGSDLYEMVFRQLFGRPLEACAPMAGRTDRAIILETLELAGISEPRRYVDPFIEGLRVHAPAVREKVALQGHALDGAAEVLAALATVSRGPAGRIHQTALTGNIRSVAEVKLSALGLRESLDLCIGAYGDDHEVRAELVQISRRRAAAVHGRLPTDFEGDATVVIGDTPLDVEAALAMGARAVGVATGRCSAAALTGAGADVVLPDLRDTGLVLNALLPRATSAQGSKPESASVPTLTPKPAAEAALVRAIHAQAVPAQTVSTQIVPPQGASIRTVPTRAV